MYLVISCIELLSELHEKYAIPYLVRPLIYFLKTPENFLRIIEYTK